MRRMLLALPLALTGCLATVQNPINYNDMAVVYSAYGTVLAVANAYRSLPLCRTGMPPTMTNICARRSVVVQLQAADRRAVLAINSAQAFINNNPTLGAGTMIAAANSAVITFQQVEALNGIGQ
jgi:hypothetical protein